MSLATMPERKSFVQAQFAKSRDYRRVLATIEGTRHCPFCKENFKYHRQPILKRSGGWIATLNSWPYKGTRIHGLLIAEAHKERFEELAPKDFSAVSRLTRWLIRRYRIRGGGLLLRFGDPRYTGATVRHLHFQIIEPVRAARSGKVKTVYFPIG